MNSRPSASHMRQPSRAGHGEGEGRIVQHRAGIATGHHRGRLDVAGEAGGSARHVGFLRLVERRVDVGIAQGGVGHGPVQAEGPGSVLAGECPLQHWRFDPLVWDPS